METNDKKALKVSVELSGELPLMGGGYFQVLWEYVCIYVCIIYLKQLEIAKIANYFYKIYLQSLIKTGDTDIKSE